MSDGQARAPAGAAEDWPEVVEGWQCIGCGRIEASRPCVGVCQDRQAHFVNAEAYWTLAQKQSGIERERQMLREFLRRFAHVTPRAGAWEESFRAFQRQALHLLAAPDKTAVPQGELQ